MHYGNNNPNFKYTLCDHVLSTAGSANDLGISLLDYTSLSHAEYSYSPC